MSLYTDDQLREWLSEMRQLGAPPIADRATDLLDILDLMASWERAVEELAVIQELCENAGLIVKDDRVTQLAPLLAMFLPVD